MTCGCGGPCCEAQTLRVVASRVHENAWELFDADVERQGVEAATLHVYSARLDGSYSTTLRNKGPAPWIRAQLNAYKATLDGYGLPFANYRRSVGLVLPGATRHLTNSWSVTGILDVLWAILNILFTGTANVTEHIDFQALGYRKTWSTILRIPVKIQNVKVEWN